MIRYFTLFIFLFQLASVLTAAADSTVVNGCWLSTQSRSNESIHDSLYNTSYYYVQFTMCLDEYYNIEINRKIKLDCCNEENQRFNGTYKIQDSTLTIHISGLSITESYIFKLSSDTLLLTPLRPYSGKPDLTNKLMLKSKWLRY